MSNCRPTTLCDLANRVLHGADATSMIKEFVDQVSLMSDIERFDAITDAPRPLIAWLDVYLAGLAESIARGLDQAPPAWTERPERFLNEPVIFGGRHSKAANMIETPAAFRRRLLFCGPVRLPSKTETG
jgi:hypothetical protein